MSRAQYGCRKERIGSGYSPDPKWLYKKVNCFWICTQACFVTTCLDQKLRSFELATLYSQKLEINSFCVPTHSEANRITLKSFHLHLHCDSLLFFFFFPAATVFFSNDTIFVFLSHQRVFVIEMNQNWIVVPSYQRRPREREGTGGRWREGERERDC